MEENSVLSLVDMETVEPKHKLNRSPGSIYVVLLLFTFGAISLTSLLENRWQIPRYLTQPALYAILAACGWLIYRHFYVSYRYTLTDQMFAIERIAGNRERTILAAPLDEICEIQAFSRTAAKRTRPINASILPRRMSTLIALSGQDTRVMYRIGPSESFLQKLTAQWQSVRAQKEL